MLEMRFCARKRVRRRGWRGKLPSCAMSLSVRSMASLSCDPVNILMQVGWLGRLTLAAPMFSIAEIL